MNPNLKKLAYQHDLCQGQGINKSKPLMVKQALVIQNERFMKGKQTQENPEIDKYPEEFFCFVDGVRFEAKQAVIRHVPISQVFHCLRVIFTTRRNEPCTGYFACSDDCDCEDQAALATNSCLQPPPKI